MNIRVAGTYLSPQQRAVLKPVVRRVEPKSKADWEATKNKYHSAYVYDLEQRVVALQKENTLLSIFKK